MTCFEVIHEAGCKLPPCIRFEEPHREDRCRPILKSERIKMFVDKTCGTELRLIAVPATFEEYYCRLYDKSDKEVAGIDCLIDEDILEINFLSVIDHHNAPTAKNSHPGTGTLLLYLACRHARGKGARRIVLDPTHNSEGFYRRFGMHRPSNRVVAAALVGTIPQFLNGKLNQEWLSMFGTHFRWTRETNGSLEGEITTVMDYLQARVAVQWEEK